MRTRLAAIALILAAARAAALGPATEWQDVPPETTLSNAVMAAGLHRAAWSGDYNDLTNKPAIPEPAPQVKSDWNEADERSPAFILNKPTIPARLGELENDVGYATEAEVAAAAESNRVEIASNAEWIAGVASEVGGISWELDNIEDVHYTVGGRTIPLDDWNMSPLKEVYVLGTDSQGGDVFPAAGSADRKGDALYVSTNRNTLYRYDAPAGEFRPIVIDESAVMGEGHTIAAIASMADYVNYQMNDSESGALVRIGALEAAVPGKADRNAVAVVATCGTAASEIKKVATPLDGNFTDADLVEGRRVWVRFDSGNTRSAPTLQVGSMTSAKRMYQDSGAAAFNAWDAGALVLFRFSPSLSSGNGGWRAVAVTSGTPAATTSSAGVVMLTNSVTNDETTAATPKAVMDATALAERTGFSEWTYVSGDPSQIPEDELSLGWLDPNTFEETTPDNPDGRWMISWFGSMPQEGSGSDNYYATSLSFSDIQGTGVGATATRAALPGYQLGSQTNKVLASEAEAEALRTAVAQKADSADAILKSGGTMDLGSVLLASHLGVKGGEWGDLLSPLWTSYGRQGIYVGRGVGGVWELRFPVKSGVLALTNDIPSVSLSGETLAVDGWSTNVVTRYSNGAVTIGERHGDYTNIYTVGYIFGSATYTDIYRHGTNSFVVGEDSDAYGKYSMAQGRKCLVYGDYSYAAGNRAVAGALGYNVISGQPTGGIANRNYTYVWQGVSNGESNYYSHGNGTYNINPAGGTGGFYIGETNFTQHVKNIAAEVSPPAEQPKRIAMFVIPVNEGGSSTYRGFELKCSTNNFASAASESVKLQFYSQSEIADEGSGSTIDKMKLFACTSYWSARDRRSYSPIGNTIDYGNDLYSVVALVDVSCLKRHPEDNGAWLSEDNEDLVWCYMRDTANDVEREQLTTEPLWRPIAPVKWFRELPSWAR